MSSGFRRVVRARRLAEQRDLARLVLATPGMVDKLVDACASATKLGPEVAADIRSERVREALRRTLEEIAR